jgi:phage tail sheath protein FI
MGKTFLGKEDDMSDRQLLVLVVPSAFGLIAVVLFVTGLWWASGIVAVLGVGATVWAHHARSNEEADEAIAAAEVWERDNGQAADDAPDGGDLPGS